VQAFTVFRTDRVCLFSYSEYLSADVSVAVLSCHNTTDSVYGAVIDSSRDSLF